MDTPEKRVAFILSQVACMNAEMEGMKVINKERELNGYSFAYDEEAFLALPDRYGLGHNAVIEYLRDA